MTHDLYMNIYDEATGAYRQTCASNTEGCINCRLYNEGDLNCQIVSVIRTAYKRGVTDGRTKEKQSNRSNFLESLIRTGYRVRKNHEDTFTYNAYAINDEYARLTIDIEDKRRLEELNRLLFEEVQNANR